MMIKRIFPFLTWFEEFNGERLRADLIAGITVALVLIPQSMAYAQLAGLPAYYGLYAALLPPMVASLFGSSHQLATGPVAVVSLMSAASIGALALTGSDRFIEYSILLAFLVGAFQFFLGVFRLGVIVNFLAHPVITGFTNAAALIIASSQLSKIFGVYVDDESHHYMTVYNVMKAAAAYTHWPSLLLAALAFALMYFLKRVNPKIPGVLVAVVVTTLISWGTGFEKTRKVQVENIRSDAVAEKIRKFNDAVASMEKLSEETTAVSAKTDEAKERHGSHSIEAVELRQSMEKLSMAVDEAKKDARINRRQLRALQFSAVAEPSGEVFYYPRSVYPEKNIGRIWRLKVGNGALKENALAFTGGGAVVGEVPRGFPSVGLPRFELSVIGRVFPAAMIISLLGFMEAISIAKAMATKTGQRVDPNQELIGQGLSNMVGSLAGSYPVSGSFSRSAVNIQAGAVSGLSSVFTSGVVIVAVLFLTPLLYHLPQSVLAAVVMMAVMGLISVKSFIHTWHAQRYDFVNSVITFAFTLAFAPHLDKGIMIGVAFSLAHYLYRHMSPKIGILSRHEDGTLRDADDYGLKKCEHIRVINFDGPLFFANTNYLEDKILELIADGRGINSMLVVGEGIIEIDASGEEMLAKLVDRLRDRGIDVYFCGLKDRIMAVIKRTHLYEKIGSDHIFRTETQAVSAMYSMAHANSAEKECPLMKVVR
jgi:MFS superfamily sulfate permease-like transporter